MLQQMLDLIRKGQVGTQGQLAQQLGVSEAMVSQMIEQLAAQGYLEEATMCVEGCQGCSLKAACGNDRELRLWSLTEKGARATGRQ